MKIKQLNIVGFGKLINKQVNLSDEMTLVFGVNEAGKSTMYHFIKTMLFGFPRKNASLQSYEPREQALFGGEMVVDHPVYGELTIKRFKTENKGKAIVVLANGSQADEAFLQDMLAPLNEELFDEVFRLDQNQLQSLASLSEENLQKQLLNIGLVGSKKLVEFQENNLKLADQVYRPRGKNPKLNQQLEEYEGLKQQLVQKENEEKVYQKKLFDRDNLMDEINEAQLFLQEERQLTDKLGRRINHFDDWLRFAELKSEVEKIEIDLDDETLGMYHKAYQKYQILDEQERRLTEEQLLHSAKTDSEELAYYLNNEEQFRQYQQDRSLVESFARDVEQLKRSLADKQEEIATLKNHLKIEDIEESFYPENKGLKEIQALAVRELKLQKNYQEQRERERDLLQQKEKAVATELEVRQVSAPVDYKYLYGAFAFSILALGFSMIIKMKWFALAFGLLGLGLLGYFLYQFFGKKETEDPQQELLALLDQQMTKNSDWLTNLDQEAYKIKVEKQAYAGIYQFNQEKTAEQWLDEINLRERLFDMQVTTQEMIESIAENEKYLEDYLANHSWLVERFGVKVSEMPAKLSEVTNHIHLMQQKQQQYLLENSDTYQIFDSLKNARQQRKTLINQFRPRLQQYGMTTFEELPAFIKKQEAQQLAKNQLEHQQRLITPNFNPEATYDLEQLTAKQAEQATKIKALEQQLKDKQEAYDALNYAIERMEEDSSLAELYQMEANLRGEINSVQDEWIVHKLVAQLSQDIQDVMGSEQLPQLLNVCSDYFNDLTLGNYQYCLFEKGQLVAQHAKGKKFTLSELSTGTKDQLYMSMRLAFLTIHSDDRLAPLLIDDSWLHYDYQRKIALFKALHKLSRHVQVICFSSDITLKEFAETYQVDMLNL
ncbi:AAA family ATPase [Vagococcus zengguangii]|uniref:YhaN AAA domain-containing protein n=1 Tax=Vagococcus zengguangii TaxID=2571750 RepID=A0A4D7CYS1_9ENTE|nr:AAA family ATPase [Vagococcus zengguangii]QCI86806.1 hypothetical protein FA707_07440 [Vagococcus zengguangii]TLG80412.1 hypothetical protein FE258_05065 [Vagococcus zengguangii]